MITNVMAEGKKEVGKILKDVGELKNTIKIINNKIWLHEYESFSFYKLKHNFLNLLKFENKF